MKYVALLRGINVGGHRKVEMKRLKHLFESMGCECVQTYLNSGNAIFESDASLEDLQLEVPGKLQEEFGFEIQTLVKSDKDIKRIASAVPVDWKNDAEQKTDIAYLFPEVDTKKTVAMLPVKREFVEVIYVKGAIIWHVLKKDYNKSRLNKIIGLKLYQLMTVRNVNTARHLAGIKSK